MQDQTHFPAMLVLAPRSQNLERPEGGQFNNITNGGIAK
jgi:hypothetical protein